MKMKHFNEVYTGSPVFDWFDLTLFSWIPTQSWVITFVLYFFLSCLKLIVQLWPSVCTAAKEAVKTQLIPLIHRKLKILGKILTVTEIEVGDEVRTKSMPSSWFALDVLLFRDPCHSAFVVDFTSFGRPASSYKDKTNLPWYCKNDKFSYTTNFPKFRKLGKIKCFFMHTLSAGRPQFAKKVFMNQEKLQFTNISRLRKFAVYSNGYLATKLWRGWTRVGQAELVPGKAPRWCHILIALLRVTRLRSLFVPRATNLKVDLTL